MAKDIKKNDKLADMAAAAVKDEQADRSLRRAQVDRAIEILGDPTEGVTLALKATGARNAVWDD